MPEPFSMSLIWLGQTAGAAVVGRLAERAVDRAFDGRRQVVVPPPPPRRHRLGDVTSDVDITVRFTPAGRRPVLLAFQTAPRDDERTQGVTVPMVLGETAHLTLPRDDYLISALVLDPPAELGGKPVLHGVGWTRRWVASTGTDRLAITAEAPTKKLLRKLGLQAPDGTSPFVLAPKPATAPRQLAPPAARPSRPLAGSQARNWLAALDNRPCQAALSRFGGACPNLAVIVSRNSLCRAHEDALKRGQPVYDRLSGRRIG